MAAHRVEPVMPPKDKEGREAAHSEELGLIKLWIDAGARTTRSNTPSRRR